MYDIISSLLSDKNNGIMNFKAFSFCHILYLLLIIGSIILVLFLYKNKSQEQKNKLINITVILALCLYIADFFLMPFSYGYINIDKLPFHLCTSMSIMCVLSRYTKFFAKFKTSFTILGLVGAMMYIVYPAGVPEADGYSYRIVQTVIYHGLMIAQGVFSIAFKDLDLRWNTLKYDLISIVSLALWAYLGNTFYSGVVTKPCDCVEGCTEVITIYNYDLNWFFVKHDALYIIPDDIDIYIAPFAMVIVIFGMCALIRFLSIIVLSLFDKKANNIIQHKCC